MLPIVREHRCRGEQRDKELQRKAPSSEDFRPRELCSLMSQQSIDDGQVGYGAPPSTSATKALLPAV